MTEEQQDTVAQVGCGCLTWLPWIVAIGLLVYMRIA